MVLSFRNIYKSYNETTTLKGPAMNKQEIKRKAEQAFNENPILFIAASAALLQGVAKVIDAVSGAQSKAAYARKMNSSSR